MSQINNWPQMQIGVGILGCTSLGTAVPAAPNDKTQIPIYTEISSRCRSITTTRGKNYELDTPRGFLNSWEFDNRDGILDPNNTSSVYYPGFTSHKMIRWSTVRNPTVNILEPNLATGGDTYGAGQVVQIISQAGQPLSTVAFSGAVAPLQGAVMYSSSYTNGAASGSRGWAFGNGYMAPGVQYTFSVYCRIPTTTLGFALTAKCYNAAATVLGTTTGATVTVNNTWQRLTVTFTPPANTVGTVFYVASTAVAGATFSLLTDQMQLEAGGSATTWTAPGSTNIQATNFIQSLVAFFDPHTQQQMLTMTTQDTLGVLSQQLLLDVHGNEVQLLNPYGYWPLGDSSSSRMTGSIMNPTTGIQQPPAVFATFGAGSGATLGNTSIVPGDPNGACLKFDNTAVSGVSWTQLNLPVPINSALTGNVSVNLWFNNTQAPATNPGDILAQTQMGVGDDFSLAIQTNGKIRFSVTYNGTQYDNIDTLAAVNDGKTHMITAIVYSASSRMQLYIDGVLQGDQARTTSRTTGQSNITFTRLGNGADNTFPYVGSIQHLSIYTTQLTSGQVTNLYRSGADGWSGDSTATRLNRIFGYTNTTILDAPPGDSVETLEGLLDSDGQSVLDAINLVAQDEQSNLFPRGDGFIAMESRHMRWKQLTPTWLLGDNGSTEIPYEGNVETELDDLKVVNYVQASRIGGASSSFSDITSINNHFYRSYPKSLTLKTLTDAGVYNITQGIVWQYKNPQERLVKAEFRPGAQANAATWNFVTSAEIGYRIQYARRAKGTPVKTLDLWIESVSHHVTFTDNGIDWVFSIEATPGLPGNSTPGRAAQMFVTTAARSTLKTSTIAGATSFVLNALPDAATNTSQSNGWSATDVQNIIIWDGANTEIMAVTSISTTTVGYTQFTITTTNAASFPHSSNVVISEYLPQNGLTAWTYNTFDTAAALDGTNILGY